MALFVKLISRVPVSAVCFFRLNASFQQICMAEVKRNSSFYSRTSNELWKGVVSVSNAGAKRGRGRRRGAMKAKNLNMGQRIGEGKINIILPGLNAPVARGSRILKIEEIGLNEEHEKEMLQLRNRMNTFRRLSVPASERGWTGGHLGGKSLGPPPPAEGCDFKDFDSRILMHSTKMIMTSTFGKQRRIRVLVACGNGKGLIGLGAAIGLHNVIVLRKALKRASRNLFLIKMDDANSVLHDFICSHGYAEVYVARRHDGYGLKCQRMIKTMCQLIGIKNLYAKLEGSRNAVPLANAFLSGLLKQKTYQQWADEKQLLVVRIDPSRNFFPEVLASPQNNYIRTLEEIPETEDTCFDRICIGGKTRLDIPELKQMFYTRLPSYKEVYLKQRVHPLRNQHDTLIERLALCDETEYNKWRYPRVYVEDTEESKIEEAAVESES